MDHHSSAHINTNMGDSRCVVGADKKIRSPGFAWELDTGVQML